LKELLNNLKKEVNKKGVKTNKEANYGRSENRDQRKDLLHVDELPVRILL